MSGGPMIVFEMVYLTVATLWLGSMVYSLVAVQPKIARLFPDERRREDFLVTLAHGNRWPVVALVGVLGLSGGVVIVTASGAVSLGYAVALGCDAIAAGIFGNVSWRHWPARIFALPEELRGFRRRLAWQAGGMTALVGAGYLVALAVSLR
jgi:hypothetical protein